MSHLGNRNYRKALPLAFCLLGILRAAVGAGRRREPFQERSAPPAMEPTAAATTAARQIDEDSRSCLGRRAEADRCGADRHHYQRQGSMPSYKDKLTGDQIKDLVGFIRDLAKKK